MSEIKISPKMKRAIKLIQDNVGIKFMGSSFDEAKDFLDKNLSKLNEVDFRANKKPSEKQEKGVKFIESMLNVEFTGSSMKDASDFIDEYFEQAQNKAKNLKERNDR